MTKKIVLPYSLYEELLKQVELLESAYERDDFSYQLPFFKGFITGLGGYVEEVEDY